MSAIGAPRSAQCPVWLPRAFGCYLRGCRGGPGRMRRTRRLLKRSRRCRSSGYSRNTCRFCRGPGPRRLRITRYQKRRMSAFLPAQEAFLGGNARALCQAPAPAGSTRRAITPGVADVVGSGRARLDAIARWLQEVARQDLEDAGFEGRGVWIVRRTRIRAEAFPRYGEQVTLRTFCSGIGRFSAERRTSLESGGGRVEAVSRWICMEPDGSRPQRLEDEFRDAYAPSRGGARRQRPRASSRPAARRRRAALVLPRHRPRHRRPRQQHALLGPAGGGVPDRGRARGLRRRGRAPRSGPAGAGRLLSAGAMRWVASPSGARPRLHPPLLRR